MRKKSERSGRTSHDPDDAPEITQEWIDGANLYRGKKLIRRGAGASTPSVTEIRERLARRSTDAWAKDSEFGIRQGLKDASPWRKFAAFLYCGKIYE